MEEQTEAVIDFGSMSDEELRQWLADKYPGRKVERDGDEIVVTIPVNLHRRNGRQVIKAESLKEKSKDIELNDSVISAIAKACVWQEELESGQYGSIEELANAKNLGRTYVGRMLRLTSLSPSIVQSILTTGMPDISLRKLHENKSWLWEQQAIWANS